MAQKKMEYLENNNNFLYTQKSNVFNLQQKLFIKIEMYIYMAQKKEHVIQVSL